MVVFFVSSSKTENGLKTIDKNPSSLPKQNMELLKNKFINFNWFGKHDKAEDTSQNDDQEQDFMPEVIYEISTVGIETKKSKKESEDEIICLKDFMDINDFNS